MRLFFALWPPEPVAQTLAEQARSLAQRFGGKATRQETIHLTLAFLGDVDEGRLPSVIQAAHNVGAAAFELNINQLGYWRHNRLFWAGCTSPPPALLSLVERLREQLRASSIACDESQRFTPHLTLVRKVADGRGLLDLSDIEPVSWSCSGFVLVYSQPTRTGSDYITLAEFPLMTA